jgi:hypothetical protein
MSVRITIYKAEGETGMTVPDYDRYIAYQQDEEVSTALRDLVCEYHYNVGLKVGESTFRASAKQEHFITRKKRNIYELTFHTLPAGVVVVAAADAAPAADPLPVQVEKCFVCGEDETAGPCKFQLCINEKKWACKTCKKSYRYWKDQEGRIDAEINTCVVCSKP